MDLGSIVSCAIHPAIGVARVGNSPDEYVIGPEVPLVTPEPDGGFKDPQGRIKRQVARFRVYGLDASGNVVGELTSADAQIAWTVHLANSKAAWYDFDVAMDIPEAETSARRNPDFQGDRSQLIIDPGPRTISGPDQQAAFDTGKFVTATVPLGEIRTDDCGRLLVFGGLGTSGTPFDNNPVTTFANNTGWYDDTSDGPVNAQVTIGGRTLDATAAWVVVAPPDYAPGIRGVVTLYDVIQNTNVASLGVPAPAQVSFTQQIYPILQRFCLTQWVNQGFNLDFGWGAPDDFLAPDRLARLASNAPADRPIREALFERFRNPDYATTEPTQLPPVYGDGMNVPPDSPRNWLAVTALQYGWLTSWAAGDFVADWDPSRQLPTSLDQVPLAQQPATLDEAALEACLGGAFHPGCEATWPMRIATMYAAPFRIKRRTGPEPDYGAQLTPQAALAPDGPLTGSGPGDITRWMAVPWQTDTSSCGSGYTPQVDPYLPTFWPARVPNHVLTTASYQHVLDDDLSTIQRLKYFNLREDWLRDLSQNYLSRIRAFVTEWSDVGILARRPGPDDPSFPSELFVETGNSLDQPLTGPTLRFDPRRHR